MRKRLFVILWLFLPVLAWVAYAILSRPVSMCVAHHWGPHMVRAGDGKFTDAAGFLQHRFYEGAWLLSWTVYLLTAVVVLARLSGCGLPSLWKWVPGSVLGFIGLNVWLRIAAGTCLFWCLFWNGKGTTHNLTQFHLKLLLMDENPATVKVVQAGSSQSHAEIDPRLLNRQLGSNIFTTELTFPGNRGDDYLFLDRKLEGHKADIIVCYLSEQSFFDADLSEGTAIFFSFRDLPGFIRLGGKPAWGLRSVCYGLLGDLAPAFWLRDPAAQRCLGQEMAGLPSRQYLSSLGADLQPRAREMAVNFRMGAQSAFQMSAFETFIARCRAQRKTVILCCGQLNPVLARELAPQLRPQMLAFLRRLAAQHDNVVLLEEADLPAQTREDYEDLTHVDPAARARFSEAIARVLENVVESKKLLEEQR